MKLNHLSFPLAAALVGALASLVTTHSARAADATAAAPMSLAKLPAAPAAALDQDPWQFAVTVPLWAPQINGNSTVRGHEANVNVPFNELKDHLDASFSLGLDVHKGKFDLYGNLGYMKFTGEHTDRIGGHTDAELKFVMANAGLAYQLIRTGGEHPFALAATAGIRYWYAETTLSHKDFNGKRDWQGGNTYDVVDPVIGLRASQYLTRKLHLDVGGDYGGFNLSNDTDQTWSATGMLTYDFCKYFSFSAGYQAVALDESNGSGASKNGLNLIFNGVAAAATFKF